MNGSSRSIGRWAVTARVLLAFLMYAGSRASQVILIVRRWGQSHLDVTLLRCE